MSDDDKSNGVAQHETEIPLGELLEKDLGGLREVDVTPATSPMFLLVFLSILLMTLAFCLPSIIGGADKVRAMKVEQKPLELQENEAAQKDLQRTLKEIESALQNPQGE